MNDISTIKYLDVRDNMEENLIRNKIVAILPWGATEPHNLHLPYLTDTILAKEISCGSVKLLDEEYQKYTAILPSVSMGSQNPGQTNYLFCIHYNYETQKHILHDTVESLRKQGIKKLIIVNGHMGNCFKPMIRDIKQEYPNFDIILINWLDIPSCPKVNYFSEEEDHAGECETSVMMYFHPELVNLDVAGIGYSFGFKMESLRKKIGWTPRNWKKESSDTGIGNPLKSTPEKGMSYANDVMKEISDLIKEFIDSDIY